ncbi:MAG: class I SAM-dependent RNA methyltransferase [Clostridia bacterium]|nr:class I SAM-dependent RNA methyltransferase [Clostridia bacterium]
MKLTAICVFGLEAVLARELANLGLGPVETENGRVSFMGSISDAAMCNLWLRSAERVYIEASAFKAYTFDDLYEGVKSIDWKEHMPSDGSFPVRASSIDSKLFSTRDCQTITKKAVADKLCSQYGTGWMPETGRQYAIEVFIHNDNARICIDTTGTGLHKRGYRRLNVEAPLKETIAASLLMISYWRPGRTMLDPFCGSGTFPIEAALMEMNIPPGLERDFAISYWGDDVSKYLNEMKLKAKADIRKPGDRHIYGSDISAKNIEIAKIHAGNAGVSDAILFTCSDVRDIEKNEEYGVLICNPPYGQRLEDKGAANETYDALCVKMKEFGTWSKYILSDSADFEKICGRKADKRRKVYNGTISCTFYQYFGPGLPGGRL